MSRLFYNKKTMGMKNMLVSKLLEQGYTVTTDFMDRFNDFCPACLRKHTIKNNEVKSVGTISVITKPDTGKAILYTLCPECAHTVVTGSRDVLNKFEMELEDVVFKTLADNV